MSTQHSPFDHQFEKLMELQEDGDAEKSPLFTELLRHGSSIMEPLSQFLIRQPETAPLSVLIRLLGKCMDERADAVVLNFLQSRVPELRLAAANALGWSRSRAALELLDRMEENDQDPRVRKEARTAIEEILRDYPNLRSVLRHHQPINPPVSPTASEEEGEVPPPDFSQRLELMATLPRLLAIKYTALPLRFDANKLLHIAVRSGSERRLIAPLGELTGYPLKLHALPAERIELGIEQLYQLGDDDFCTFHRQLRPIARDEVVDIVLSGVHPEEPVCPLDEANDAVEAAQVFLSLMIRVHATEMVISHQPPGMEIRGTGGSGGSMQVEPPAQVNRERFLMVLRMVAGFDPGRSIAEEKTGTIAIPGFDPPLSIAVESHRSMEHELLMFRPAK